MQIKELVFWEIICVVNDAVVGQDNDRTFLFRSDLHQIVILVDV